LMCLRHIDTMMKTVSAAVALAVPAMAAIEKDLVAQLPSFPVAPFKIYSGYLEVPDYGGPYSKLMIHYQFHEAQSNPRTAPVATWHQGGPGSSSFFGLYSETGYFQIEDGDNGEIRYRVNENAWNKVANMLYLESPAGSSGPLAGFSYCYNNDTIARVCHWDDVTQAEAYAHTLKAFFEGFPEYANNDLYLTGESYAGQYLPNIANYIINNTDVVSNLKGIAVGNGCWGGSANSVDCNGPNSEQNDMDMYYGKGLMSKKMYDHVQASCNWPRSSLACEAAQQQAMQEVGPHNIYFIYDTCPLGGFEEWHRRSGKSVRWVQKYHRDAMSRGLSRSDMQEELTKLGGGTAYGCGQDADQNAYFRRDDVTTALHLDSPGKSRFGYRQSGPASQLLYPELVQKIRVFIYNGDADGCVPYKGNEEWTTKLAADGFVRETAKWHPWYATESHRGENHAPAGYATSYKSNTGINFQFVTIRLAGHMVPTYQSDVSFRMIERFFADSDW
jgi:carboxypeptidase C (cathepsin A)